MNKFIRYFDSFKKSYPNCGEILLDFIELKCQNEGYSFNRSEWSFTNFTEFESQKNCYDCGIYCLLFIKRLCMGQSFDFNSKNFYIYRKIILFETITNSRIDTLTENNLLLEANDDVHHIIVSHLYFDDTLNKHTYVNNHTKQQYVKCPHCDKRFKHKHMPYVKHLASHTSMDKKFSTNSANTLPIYLNDMIPHIDTDFSILHLNIRSVPKYLSELDMIVKTGWFDIIMLNETKLDSTYPLSFYNNIHYYSLRKDKSTKESGLLIVIKKEYKLISSDYDINGQHQIDYIQFQLLVDNQKLNFISCYKSPHINDLFFLDALPKTLFCLVFHF